MYYSWLLLKDERGGGGGDFEDPVGPTPGFHWQTRMGCPPPPPPHIITVCQRGSTAQDRNGSKRYVEKISGVTKYD